MRKKRYSMFGRTVAFLLLIMSLVCIPVGVIGTYWVASEGFYIASADKLKDNYLDEYFEVLGKNVLKNIYSYGEKTATQSLEGVSAYYRVTLPDGGTLGNYEEGIACEWFSNYRYTQGMAGSNAFEGMEQYQVEFFVPTEKNYPDYVALICFVANNSEFLAIFLPVIAVGGMVIAIGCFVYLMCAAGWNRRENKQTSGILGFVPTDLFVILVTLLSIWLLSRFWRGFYNWGDMIHTSVLLGPVLIIVVAALMSLSARVKAGTIWSYSVIGLLWKWIGKLLGMLGYVVRRLPLIWKTALFAGVFTIAEVIVWIWVYSESNRGWAIRCGCILGLVEKLILLPIVFYIVLKLRELQIAGKKLAEGHVNYKVDTKHMFGEIKQHGESLNRISEGVAKAVNERMKSEHLKTELITNVSHDIKTPLTSIINYADLINKEKTDNETIKEYSGVLYRQSTRLKKLIEDLVAASKASTGNIDVNMVPCDVGVLLMQAAGEFEQRLFDKNIDLVSKQPPEPVQIMADPKLLWRVFDNLMTNICKYAQGNTRVYLAVEEVNGQAVISFKNISEYPLDISADELMERFVRGDRSRHTEGSGLGLSIAKSLTELLNGTLELMIDGDLFKVLVSFPINAGEAVQTIETVEPSERTLCITQE